METMDDDVRAIAIKLSNVKVEFPKKVVPIDHVLLVRKSNEKNGEYSRTRVKADSGNESMTFISADLADTLKLNRKKGKEPTTCFTGKCHKSYEVATIEILVRKGHGDDEEDVVIPNVKVAIQKDVGAGLDIVLGINEMRQIEEHGYQWTTANEMDNLSLSSRGSRRSEVSIIKGQNAGCEPYFTPHFHLRTVYCNHYHHFRQEINTLWKGE